MEAARRTTERFDFFILTPPLKTHSASFCGCGGELDGPADRLLVVFIFEQGQFNLPKGMGQVRWMSTNYLGLLHRWGISDREYC
ncbi:hypothetical protein [Microvirga sp. G4-2]|uniref:hypothetical protein n=1 Tax=Microvirga sp. G4-2 TaxID=3434467 RepID=UPI004044A054